MTRRVNETMKFNTFNLNRHRLLVAIIAISVLFRIGAAIYMGNEVVNLPGTFDQISYHKLALRVLNGHGFSFGEEWWPATAAGAPTAHWSFLYTFYLVVVYAVFGPNPVIARIIQAILMGIFQPLVAYLLGSKVFNRKVGCLAAALTMVYAYYIYYSATLMTEPFYITAIMASLYVSIRLVEVLSEDLLYFSRQKIFPFAIILGLLLGVAVLLRQLFLLVVPFIFVWIWFSVHAYNGRSAILPLTITGGTILAMILPFTIYNFLRFDQFVLLNTNAGYAFFWGNHPVHGDHFYPILPAELGTYKDLIPEDLLVLDEAAMEKELLKRGLQFIIEDPIRMMQLALSRIPEYIKFWPSRDSSLVSNLARVSSFGILWPFMLIGMLSVFFSRRYRLKLQSPISLLLLFVLFYSGIHVLTWTLIRYRLPVDAVMILFAAHAILLGLKYLSEQYPGFELIMKKIGADVPHRSA